MAYHKVAHVRKFILVPVLIIFFGGGLLFWNTYANNPYPDEPTTFGVTFSTLYARELGLDWQKVYIETLDDLKIRNYRIPVYWNEIERDQGSIWLDDVRWMLDEAEKRDAHVFLAIGRRVPRWPECHPPDWTRNMPEEEIQEHELHMIKTIVEEFKDHPAVDRWQVQNEPFFAFFGECAEPDEDFIRESINLVKELDPSRPVLTTDSGELSTWSKTSDVADVLGISMYRTTWNSVFGYFYYPLPPVHYSKKAEFVAPFVNEVIVTELQVEPWVPSTILTTTLDEQYRSMNPKRFESNIDFARRTGFSEVYLWGVEWWAWLRDVHEEPAMWNAGRDVFML